MNITNRLTWLSYLIFLLMGSIFVSQGVLIISIARTYNIDISTVGYLIFIPAAIQAVVTYYNGYILDKVNIKTEMYIGLAMVLIGFVLLITGSMTLFIIGLIPTGIGYGILVTVPNYIILQLHPKNKFQKLNFLNFFFSLGGIAGPLIIGQLLQVNIPWQLTLVLCYIFIIFIAGFAFVITIFTNEWQKNRNLRKA